MKLGIIVGSTRPNRQTPKQAWWVATTAEQMDGVEVDLIDLKEFDLPIFNEPMSPRYNQNRQIDPRVQKWLDRIEGCDAYVFVTAEYNHSIPGVLKNAIDYLTWEMNRKPGAIVSHGVNGGARAAMTLKEVLSESKCVPIPNFVAMHGMSEMIDEQGNLAEEAKSNPYGPQSSLQSLLEELKWYHDALAPARDRELAAV